MSGNGTTNNEGFALNPKNQAQLGAAQLGQLFALQDTQFTLANASTKAPFGTNTVDQQKFDAANHAMFNSYASLGVSCTTVSMAAGRPDLDVSGNGAACPFSSPEMEAAMKANNIGFNNYGTPASQVLLAESDLRYAQARFVDKENYTTPSISDFTFQPRLMGTRDTTLEGCKVNESGVTECALTDDPLPYPMSDDPRTNYGALNRSSFWDNFPEEDSKHVTCDMNGNSVACDLKLVEAGSTPPQIPTYKYTSGR